MADSIATVSIEEDDKGLFWVELDGSDHKKGPFETEELAAEAARDLIEGFSIALANHLLGANQ
ncbi:hypothetical protein [Paracoccus litorisediminis]|uniref:HicB family protein n=1 Tax=Paracoccus litorisediminis TaxID=2006130 RepID=A0A844HPR1_9RHOB|nr:hypothetical protein [Paracoccus litorisediminis]MTH61119.1 hypothetical protein [Paracoccus litorisediminis]